MDHLCADDTPLSVLGYLTEPVEILAADGILLGCFTPDPARVKQLCAELDHPLDPAEFARRAKAEGPARTTREVFEHLLTLTTDPKEQVDLRRKIEELHSPSGV